MFAATYGLAAAHLLEGHTQVVVIGNDATAEELYRVAVAPYSATKSVLHLRDAGALKSLPAALAETVPNLPGISEGKSVAVICTGFSCRPPIRGPEELKQALEGTPG